MDIIIVNDWPKLSVVKTKKAERRTEQPTNVTLPSNTLRDGVRLIVVRVSYNHSQNNSRVFFPLLFES